ncbi:MAG: dienelactone hydrolase family protein [Hyphomicrobiales bacterium]|nr:dienelactone hydrolase family protein [Hyphomicrobiales bacterium]
MIETLMTPKLDGPRVAPASGGPAKQLIVFLHGYGANGDDLIGLAREMRKALPDAAFVSPHAPEPLPGPYGGRQWFPLTLRDPSERWRGVVSARGPLDAFLDAELAARRLGDDALALVGFSQGTMVALHTGPRRPRRLGAVVGFSGLLAGPERLAAEAVTRPPVLLVHGDRDDVIPVEALHQARAGLASAEIPVEWHVRPGLGHGIDPMGLQFAVEFLAMSLAQ